jgi:hypothetical protein
MLHTLRKLSGRGDDTIAEWDTTTVTAARLQEIETEFQYLLREGYFAADITEGRNVLVKDFDPDADLLMLPRMQGG